MAVKDIKDIKETLTDRVNEKSRFLGRLLSDRTFRLLTSSAFGGTWNLIHALFHLILAAVYHSYWFLTLGVYYFVIFAMRASALHLSSGKGVSEKAAAIRNGILTLMLAVILCGTVCLTIVEKEYKNYPLVIALAVATFTFFITVNAIRNLIKVRKDRTLQKKLLRTTSMVYALGSMFSLERMMIGTFGDAGDTFAVTMEALSGAGFSIIIVIFGIYLIRTAFTMHE